MTTYHVRITTPGWALGRTGTARPAFARGHYHVALDGETDTRVEERYSRLCGWRPVICKRELLFTASEFEVQR